MMKNYLQRLKLFNCKLSLQNSYLVYKFLETLKKKFGTIAWLNKYTDLVCSWKSYDQWIMRAEGGGYVALCNVSWSFV